MRTFDEQLITGLSILAQTKGTPAAAANQNSVLLWVGVLLVTLLGGTLVIFLVRRRVLGNDGSAQSASGLMDSLRQMRDSGQMTEEEYEATRRAMTRRVVERGAGSGGGGGGSAKKVGGGR